MQSTPKIDDTDDYNGRRFEDLTISEALIANADQSRRTLKTFTGVFCPVALAQFSSLLFLRLGFVLGQTGFLIAIVQLVMAYSILVLTVLSICAISTNGAIKGGGVYFMISRTLGPEIGGSIGILFFLANVFSSALYMAGFVEGLTDNFGPDGRIHPDVIPDGTWWNYLFATCVCIFCLVVCLIGGSMFAKTNLFIFLIVFVCFISVIVTFFFHPATTVKIPRSNKYVYYNISMEDKTANYTGLSGVTLRENLYYGHYEIDFTTMETMSFLGVFSILFAGVTGIMNGANMSGELKQPAISIPRGTLAATLFTFICYFLSLLLTAATCDRYLLLNNYLYMQAVNYWKPFVMIGIFCTCLSAGLGNLIGASRILFALAKDDIFGILLKPAKMATKSGNPIAAVLISFILVQVVMLIGKLNLIAPVVSVFFLLAYGSVNLACALLDLASASNFRPTFKYFSWHTSIVGLICSLGMCFLINYKIAIGIFMLFIVLIILLNFRRLDYAWGSIGQALLFHQVRKYLLLIDSRKEHVKYWRPHILLLIANPRSQASLMQFVNLLKKGGLFVIGHVMKGSLDNSDHDPSADMQKRFIEMKEFLKVKAFVDVTIASSVREGCQQLARLSGLGGMTVNTVCMGFWDDCEPQDILMKINHQMKTREDWTGSPPSSEMSQNFSPNQTSISASQSNASINSSTDVSHYKVAVGETRPLVIRKGIRLNVTNIRMKYFNNILRTKLDSKFIDDLPKIRLVDEDHNRDVKSGDGDHGNISEQLSVMEYVGIIADSIKLKKNVCLCRHFHKMDLIDLKERNALECQFIDVWPINFFQPGSASHLDKTCMFMLQLSCILRMSPQWNSKCKIRVHICLDYYSSVGDIKKNVMELWNELLTQWRISAQIVTVALDDVIVNLESMLKQRVISSGPPDVENAKTISSFNCNLPNAYVQEINNIIKSHTSISTAVCFFYLPDLPNATNGGPNWKRYIDQLTLLTNDLPPSVIVHGQHEVISSAL